MPNRTDRQFLALLHEHGATHLDEIRFKNNRRTIFSLGRDGRSANIHEAFRDAPESVVQSLATLAQWNDTPRYERNRAQRDVQAWVRTGGAEAMKEARKSNPRRAAGAATRRRRKGRYAENTPCVGTPAQQRAIRALYQHFNDTLFGGELPADVRLRLSNRMSRRLGHCAYHRESDGTRSLTEIALNIDLLLEGNDGQLRETLKHEMAHAEAFVKHNHAKHGVVWKRIARRVGCQARACTKNRIQTSGKGERVTRVPPIPEVAPPTVESAPPAAERPRLAAQGRATAPRKRPASDSPGARNDAVQGSLFD